MTLGQEPTTGPPILPILRSCPQTDFTALEMISEEGDDWRWDADSEVTLCEVGLISAVFRVLATDEG